MVKRKRKKMGAPEHKPTKPKRDKVMWRVAQGWKKREIAMEIGISIPTLDKHYMVELETGWVKKKGEALDLLVTSARNGNVSAQDKLLRQINVSNPEWTPPDVDTPAAQDQGAEAPSVLGKKAQAEAAAQTAGEDTEWGNDLTPGSKPN